MIKFIDLFAGIGGFRIALERLGLKCVYSAEINSHACEMYKENFSDNPYNDVTTIDPNQIPYFDILCAGFPCQSFSISGKQKGFSDLARGTLFFDICRIIDTKRPSIVFLENVGNLEKHDKGKTLKVILDLLVNLGYFVNYKILNAHNFGVPQNRERIIIVGSLKRRFDFDKIPEYPSKPLVHFLDIVGNFHILDESEYTLIEKPKIQQKSGLMFVGYRNKKIRVSGVREGTEHLSRVHKQSNRIYSSLGYCPTISSQEKSGRYWVQVSSRVRKLTLSECYRIFGFPDSYKKVGSPSQLYERIGNSVCIPMVEAIGQEIVKQNFGESMPVSQIEEILNTIYTKAEKNSNWELVTDLDLQEKQWIKVLVQNEENFKGVYTVAITSIVKKIISPNQDIRLHKIEFLGGYSGRSLDTKHITPFLKSKNFLGAMKESGWLTRSLEQPYPYDLKYGGKINKAEVKEAFLYILDSIQKEPQKANKFLIALFSESIKIKKTKEVELINPIIKESDTTITNILETVQKHFNFKYKTRGKSILPVIALYSIYECLMLELPRYQNKNLVELASHNSSDRSSGEIGDIVVKDCDGKVYEAVEVKSEIIIDEQIIQDSFRKIKNSSVQRYYILSTKCDKRRAKELSLILEDIRLKHGCQIIINGVFDTLRYYLRLITTPDLFINKYIDNLSHHKDLNSEHKIAWNIIIKN